jgi:hypothetical protein
MIVSRNGRKVTISMSAVEARDMAENMLADADAEGDAPSPKHATAEDLLKMANATGD